MPKVQSLIVRPPNVFRERQSIDARIRHEVLAIDLAKRALRVRALESGGESWEGFDQLLIATGGIPRRPPLEHSDARGIFGVQTLNDGLAVRTFLEEEHPKKAVVVGGGYIGLEMAEALVARDLDVTLIEQRTQPMATFDPDMGAVISEGLTEMGIHVHTTETVVAFETIGAAVSAVLTTHGTIPADIVILGLGTAPNIGLAAEAGVPIGTSGSIAVDERMQAEVPGVWAAGDCAEKFHRVSKENVSIALGTHANKEGRVAGINLGGGQATFPGVLGTATSKVCGLELARTGLNELEATSAGFDHLSATVDSTTRAGYYPGAAEIKTKVVFERGSGRLLGGQIIGQEGAAKRIDVIAVALWNEMTVDEIVNLDLSYAPPFSPVWDPVLIAARKAAQTIEADAGGAD